jgi:inner membrane protein
MGSVGLLIILAVVMYMTRKINWYEVETEQQENEN